MKVFSSALVAYAGALAVGLAVEATPIPVVEGDPDSFYSVLRRVQVYMDAYAPFNSFEYGIAESNGVYIVTHWDTSAIPPPQLLDGVNTFPSLEIAEADPDEVAVAALGDNRRSWEFKPPAVRGQIKQIKKLARQAAKSPRLKVLENEYFALLDALPGDPVPQTPSLEEAKALVDERLGVALAAKYRELLSELDLELSRYSTTWWDDAARHDETDVPAEFLEALAMTDGEARQAQALSSSIALVVDDTGEVTGTARVLVSTDGVPVVVSDSASPVVPIEDQIAAFLQRLPAERARTRALQRSLAASIPTNAVLEDIEDLAAAFPRWEDNVGRQVHPGEFYTYDGTDVYRVVQGHVTQADWSPPLAPALFLHLPPAGPSGCPPFVQPTGAHDAYAIGDCVEFEGANYVSLIDANTYSPSAYPAGWELQE